MCKFIILLAILSCYLYNIKCNHNHKIIQYTVLYNNNLFDLSSLIVETYNISSDYSDKCYIPEVKDFLDVSCSMKVIKNCTQYICVAPGQFIRKRCAKIGSVNCLFLGEQYVQIYPHDTEIIKCNSGDVLYSVSDRYPFAPPLRNFWYEPKPKPKKKVNVKDECKLYFTQTVHIKTK